MTHSVHMVTTGSSAGGPKTSDHKSLTDIGYEILQIIQKLQNEKDSFALNPKKADIAGICEEYRKAHPDKKKDAVKHIVTAEVTAFINLSMIQEKTTADSAFSKLPKGELSLLPKAKERMVEHEKLLAKEAAEAERLAQIPPKDPLAIEDIHFDILLATQSYAKEKPPHGTTQVFIVGRVIGGNRSLRDEANAAFSTLENQQCFVSFKQFDHMPPRYRLSERGAQILEKRPERFTPP